jgi:hypothetical protein
MGGGGIISGLISALSILRIIPTYLVIPGSLIYFGTWAFEFLGLKYDVVRLLFRKFTMMVVCFWGTTTAVTFLYLARLLDYFPFACLALTTFLLCSILMACYDAWDPVGKQDPGVKNNIITLPLLMVLLGLSVLFNVWGFENEEIEFFSIHINTHGIQLR